MDVRELILDRLTTVVAGLSGFDQVMRNATEVSDTGTYGIILDGSEEEYESDPVRNALAPRRVLLKPNVVISAVGESGNIGAVVNTQRGLVIKAVLTDPTLQGYCIDKNIRFLGSETVAERGRATVLSMNIEFGFTYLLKLADL